MQISEVRTHLVGALVRIISAAGRDLCYGECTGRIEKVSTENPKRRLVNFRPLGPCWFYTDELEVLEEGPHY